MAPTPDFQSFVYKTTKVNGDEGRNVVEGVSGASLFVSARFCADSENP